MADENVTIRRRHKTSLNESFDLSFESTNSEVRRHSLPDLSTGYDSEEEDLKNELLLLRNELESAHLEIVKLSEENLSLKDALNKQKLKLQMYHRICSEPRTRATTPRKKMSRTLREEDNTSLIDLEQNTLTSDPPIDGATCTSTDTLRENGNCCTSLYVKPKVVNNVLQPEVHTPNLILVRYHLIAQVQNFVLLVVTK
ncbi:unnamed protein product [Parnassius apollo]|uniref:(apollo) hypothetical protein n=1 Tax=Parnassius apollo TaxID=110799 RepID=A0A8S3WSH2_PARAO|nr:unnamed protein product [Parnassius apollo]